MERAKLQSFPVSVLERTLLNSRTQLTTKNKWKDRSVVVSGNMKMSEQCREACGKTVIA